MLENRKTEKMLELEDARVEYGGLVVLNNAGICVDEGEIVVLMGPNGAGKSTILKACFGIAPLTQGKVRWHGDVIKKPIPHEMVERGLSYVPQGRRVFKHLSVLENLEVGGHMIKSKKIREERIADVLETFPALKAKLKSKSSELSGGQQQMLAIARGLMTDPKVLLLDEPTLGLSPKLVKEVFAHIDAIRKNRKIGIVVVEHNLKSLMEVADRAVLLERGVVVASGEAKKIAEGSEFKRLLLGHA